MTRRDARPPAPAAPGAATRYAAFVLLLVAGLVALLFAVRLTAAAFGWGFSPFDYLTGSGAHGLVAGVLVAGLVILGVLVWLVLRYDDEVLWLASADGGVLVRTTGVAGPAGEAASGAHPDVVRAEVWPRTRRGALSARVRVWARPMAVTGPIQTAVATAVGDELARLTGREPEAMDVRVKVLTVPQLKRYLP